MKKIISTLALAGIICIATFAMAADLIQKDGNGRFQAELQNVPLSDVAKFMQKTHGVTFKGDAGLLQNPVSVTFKDLDMEAMLKKILARTNHVFAYDSQGKVTEVRLLAGGGQNGVAGAISKPGIQPETQSTGGNQASASLAAGINGTMPAPSQEMEDVTQTVDDITSFKVGPNNKDEVTSFKVDPNHKDEITTFKVEENAQPPIGEVKEGTAEKPDEITSFKVETDSN